MALRGKEEIFVRRFAAGGNDEVPYDPRVYGDHSRRFAARGNEMIDHENVFEPCDDYSPRRFAARGNEDHDHIYDSTPVFDVYEDEKWYFWFGSTLSATDKSVHPTTSSSSTEVVSGINLQEDKVSRENTISSDKPGSWSYGVMPGFGFFACGDSDPSNTSQIEALYFGVNQVGFGSQSTNMEEELNISILRLDNIQRQKDIISTKDNDLQMLNQLVGLPRPSKFNYCLIGGDLKAIKSTETGALKPNNIMIATSNGGCTHSKPVKLKANKSRLCAPFDPGGISQELRWVMVILNKECVDVPFDPGGFDLKAKLEDEFFQRRGV